MRTILRQFVDRLTEQAADAIVDGAKGLVSELRRALGSFAYAPFGVSTWLVAHHLISEATWKDIVIATVVADGAQHAAKPIVGMLAALPGKWFGKDPS